MHRPVSVALTVLLTTVPVAAQTPEYLPAATAVKAIMDGRPWNGLSSEGRRAKITFNRDGTGTFDGPITMSLSWEIKRDDVCIRVSFVENKCVRFRPIARGFQAYVGSKLDMTFTR